MNQIEHIMAGIKPDTGCWDDDTGKDVWSYSEELVRAAIEQALAVQLKQEPVHQFRSPHCSDWYDGVPDHQDGHGPYDVRTLYTAPYPHLKAMQQALDCLEDIFGKNKVDVGAINALREVLGSEE